MQKWRYYLAYCTASILQLLSLDSYAEEHAVILQYHHISDSTPKSTSVTPRVFAEHLDYLKENNFQVLPLTQITQTLKKGKSLPPKSVAITFDDAYKNIYENAFPLLKKRQWPFTIFVSTMPVNKNYGNFLSWLQMQEMAKYGATIANHTSSHEHLVEKKENETDKQWLSRVKEDILAAETQIKQHIGHSVKHLAWPFGEATPELQTLIKKLGYVGLGQQSGPAGFLSDFTLLPRFPMAMIYANKESFTLKVNTLPLPVKNKTPQSMIFNATTPKPSLILHLEDGRYQKKELRCYASEQGELDVNWLEGKKNAFSITAKKMLPVGRSRYNCTAPSNSGKQYYWYSHPWLQLSQEGKAID